jgi:hypothetical protein
MAQTHRGGKNEIALVLASGHQSPRQFHFVLNVVAKKFVIKVSRSTGSATGTSTNLPATFLLITR